MITAQPSPLHEQQFRRRGSSTGWKPNGRAHRRDVVTIDTQAQALHIRRPQASAHNNCISTAQAAPIACGRQ
jgi:hypothetical protein